SVGGFDPEDDVIEVSSTSQLVRAGEGELAALVAKDKAARFEMPVQSVTGGRGTLSVEPQAFREPSGDPSPFASRPATPAPGPFSPAPPPSPFAAAPSAQPDVWFPGEPSRSPAQGPPTGVFGTVEERPLEAWQVRQPPQPAPTEPDELPVVTGITMLEDEELPLVQALPLDEEPQFPQEPWVVDGRGRNGHKG